MLDTAHQIILVESLYTYFVKQFGNLLYLAHPQKYASFFLVLLYFRNIPILRLLLFVALLTGITDAMVQSIFIMRAWYRESLRREMAAHSRAADSSA